MANLYIIFAKVKLSEYTMIIFRNLRDLLLMAVICLGALQSCCGCEEEPDLGRLWTITNNSNFEVFTLM